MLVAVDQVEIETNPQTRESRALLDSTAAYVRRNWPRGILRIYALPNQADAGHRPPPGHRRRPLALSPPGCRSCSTGLLNGDNSGHIQSLGILGAVLFIAAVQLFALGVYRRPPRAAGRTQRVIGPRRRVELALGVEPSHYEPGAPERCRPLAGGLGRSRAAPRGSADSDTGVPRAGVGLTGVITLRLLPPSPPLGVLSKPEYGGHHGAPVGGLHHHLDPLPAGRPAPLAPHLRERLAKGEPIGRRSSRLDDQLSLAATFAVASARLQGPIQDGLPQATKPSWTTSAALLLRRQLLRPRLPRRTAELGLFTALILSGRASARSSRRVVVSILEGQSAVAIGIVAAPAPAADGRAARVSARELEESQLAEAVDAKRGQPEEKSSPLPSTRSAGRTRHFSRRRVGPVSPARAGELHVQRTGDAERRLIVRGLEGAAGGSSCPGLALAGVGDWSRPPGRAAAAPARSSAR